MIKKLSIYLSAVALMVGAASCEDDNTPVLQIPEGENALVLNTPPFSQQLNVLNPEGTMEFSVAEQPDYGFVASVNYGLEISLDKTNIEVVTPKVLTNSKMSIEQSAIAIAMCKLMGIESEDAWNGDATAGDPKTLYVRATAQLPQVENSKVVSDWITMSQVQPYFAVAVPGYIYLVGSPEGWAGPDAGNAAHYAEWRLFESPTNIGSKIYSGVFNMPAAPMFRFYTALTGWDGGDSMGLAEGDTPTDCTLEDGQWSGTLMAGKGALNFPDFTGGKMTIVVNLNDNSVQVMAGAQTVVDPQYIYMIGGLPQTCWDPPIESNKDKYAALVDKTDSGIYTATLSFDAEPGFAGFRFVKTLAADDATSPWDQCIYVGAEESDANVEIDLPYSGAGVLSASAKANWQIKTPLTGKTVKFTVNLTGDTPQVSFEVVE